MISFYLGKCFILGLLIKNNIYNDKIIKILLKNVYKCGVVPIKMIQWVLPIMKLLELDNNIINILDIVRLVNIVIDPSNMTNDEVCAADLNSDGLINILDIVTLVNIVIDESN